MAIVSLIVFDNDDDAIRFHSKWFNTQLLELQSLTRYGTLVTSHKLPTLFCNELEPFPHKRIGWTFRPTRGWWVCPTCLRPNKTKIENSFGKNIIELIKTSIVGAKL